MLTKDYNVIITYDLFKLKSEKDFFRKLFYFSNECIRLQLFLRLLFLEIWCVFIRLITNRMIIDP